MIAKETFWVLCFQIAKMLNGLISILIVPLYLDIKDQGLWFLMLSFGSIIMLFSASQNNIILIFGGNEFKHLSFQQFLTSDRSCANAYIKYSNFFFLSILSGLSLFVFLIYYLYTFGENISVLTFFLYIFGLFFFALNFATLTYIESFNEVSYANKLKTLLVLSIGIIMTYFLMNHYGLKSLYISYLLPMILFFLYLSYRYNVKIHQIIKEKTTFSHHKKKIFLNYFKKNSFSMVSGFLLFQIYTPIVYYFYGSIYSAKVGLSIAIMTALFAVSSTVLHAKLPFVIKLIANKKYNEAHQFYKKILFKSLILYITGMLIGIFLLFYVNVFEIYNQRVVGLHSFVMLSMAWLLQLITYELVTFTRLFKRELFVKLTLLSSVYILVTTTLILEYMSVEYIFLGMLSSYLFALPWIYMKYKQFMIQKMIV